MATVLLLDEDVSVDDAVLFGETALTLSVLLFKHLDLRADDGGVRAALATIRLNHRHRILLHRLVLVVGRHR